ncbi:N-acetylglucosamine 6-phosphate deacetylase [Candidatus Koribacter versatilis Ellin345]|uniref:N-acetylglucosamine 6-phosphate deacetylase n=1 Tax=Koribacter versatilis (strain Ellin345) TaxID=204669 RepID=Q1IMW9_KORVE|nr:N-acetylglucosamine-6-phosphate deacetylase [Candidatus Koribacter versatilis]ABF41781.1 N-acetylglucosamine 6-phosphate deacetylase [Candidatus Koribacter versatilis Ellin345]
MKTALLAREILTPLDRIHNGILIFEDGCILEVGNRDCIEVPRACRTIDLGDAILTPGFIDLHIHGGAGHDVMEGDDAALEAVELLIAKHGVTSYCPTTVTAATDVTLVSLNKIGHFIERMASHGPANNGRARPLGVHLEGPFLAESRRGVHPPNHLQAPSIKLFHEMWQAAIGRVKVLTIAPELPGAIELIHEARKRGVVVSLGHSNADLCEAKRGISAGGHHATHTFNAMRPLQHRDAGLLGAILTQQCVTADIIVDGIHVDPTVVKLFLRAKGVEGAVLITDATSATGMPDGTYHLGNIEVEVKDGQCISQGKLAGSVLTLDRAVRNVMDFAGWTLQNSVRLATYNPARVLGVENSKGVLKAGADADILVMNAAGEIRNTIIGGIGI